MKELSLKSNQKASQGLGSLKPDALDIIESGSLLKGHVAWNISGSEVQRVSSRQVGNGTVELLFISRRYKGKRVTKREMLFLAKVYKSWGSYATLKLEYIDSLLAIHRSAAKANSMDRWDKLGLFIASGIVPFVPAGLISVFNGIAFLPVYGIGFLASLAIGSVWRYLTETLPAYQEMGSSGVESLFGYSEKSALHPDFVAFSNYLHNEWYKIPSEVRKRLQIENPTPLKVDKYRAISRNHQKAQRGQKALTSSKAGSWANHLSLLTAVKDEWRAWEMGILKVVQYPALFDMRESSTVGFHRELMYAESVKPQVGESYDASHPFARAVAGLELTWTVAKGEAKRIAQSNFKVEERVRLSRAMDLLRIALDKSGNPAERQSSYQRAMKQLEGLLILPDTAKFEIESGLMMKSLEK